MIITGNAYLVLELASVMNAKARSMWLHILHLDSEVVTSYNKLVKEISICLTNGVLDLLFGTDDHGIVVERGTVFVKYSVKIQEFPYVFEEMRVLLSSYFRREIFLKPIQNAEPEYLIWDSFVKSNPVLMQVNELIEFTDGNFAGVIFDENGKIRGDGTRVLELGIGMHKKAEVIVNNMVRLVFNEQINVTNIWLHRAVIDLNERRVDGWTTVFALLKTAVGNHILLRSGNDSPLGVLDQHCNENPQLWANMMRTYMRDVSRG